MLIRDKDFLPGLQPDELAWAGSGSAQLRAPVSLNSLRSDLKITAPVVEGDSGPPIGAVVAGLSLDSILSEAARAWRLKDSGRGSSDPVDAPRTVVAQPNQIGRSPSTDRQVAARTCSDAERCMARRDGRYKAGKNEFQGIHFIPSRNLASW